MQKQKNKKHNSAGTVAMLGVLGAQALAISFLESFIPPIPGLPPGAKLGLSNIVTMFTAYSMGFGSAIYITILKALFAGITRGVTAFLMSLTGGVFSTVVMVSLMRIKSKPFGFAGIGIASAVAHNAGQLLTACVLSSTLALLNYAPLLLFFAVGTGLATGTVLKLTMPALESLKKHLIK